MKRTEGQHGGLHLQEPAAIDQGSNGNGGAGIGRHNTGGDCEADGHERHPGNGSAGEPGNSGVGIQIDAEQYMETHPIAGKGIPEGIGEFRAGEISIPGDRGLLYQQRSVAENLLKLRSMIAYDGTVDRDTLVLQTRTLLAASGEMLFEAGKRLCILKETNEYGSFLKALDEIGVDHKTAQRFMNATVRLSKLSNASSVTLLGKTKIYDLALLDDDYLKELDENGTIAGLELDEYDRMTTRELRAKVRKLNEEKKSHDEASLRAQTKQQKLIHELHDKVDNLLGGEKGHLWSEQAKQILSEIPPLKIQIIQALVQLRNLVVRAKELSLDFPAPRRSIYKEFESLSDELMTYSNDFHANMEGLQPLPDDFTLADLDRIEIDPETQKAIDAFERTHGKKNTQDAEFEDGGMEPI